MKIVLIFRYQKFKNQELILLKKDKQIVKVNKS